MKNLFPTIFSTVKVGDASFITTSDPQYGEQSKPVVYFIPPMVDGLHTGKNTFNITFPLIPNFFTDAPTGLLDLFSWTELPYDGGTLISQQMVDDNVVTESWEGKTYPGQGALSFKPLIEANSFNLQASYSFNDQAGINLSFWKWFLCK